jgi:hypothetical protein
VYSGNNQSKQYKVTLYPSGVGAPEVYSVTVVSSALTENRVPADPAASMFVTARDASLSAQDMGRPSSNVFSKNISSVYTPADYLVSFTGSNGKTYRSKAYPVTGAAMTITLADADVGISVENASDLQALTSNPAENFSLAADIDLTEVGTWTGPTGYSGKFNGNGYTIKNLKLLAGTGTIGLFNTLGNGAVVEDFTVEATTVGTPNLSSLQFGAVVGASTANVTIRKVNVKGDFNFGNITGSWVNIGGLVAMVGGTLTIDKCSSALNINVDCTLGGNIANTSSYGGLVSFARSANVTITDSYTTGNIIVRTDKNQVVLAGGLVGGAGLSVNMTITNCYASGNVVANTSNRTAWTANYDVHSSGLVGCAKIGEAMTKLEITNSAALNQQVLALPDAQQTYVNQTHSGRILSDTARIGTLSLTNNFALKDMVTGSTAAVYPGASVVGAADAPEGLGKTLAQFEAEETWEALNFSQDIWDFSTISALGRPLLR